MELDPKKTADISLTSATIYSSISDNEIQRQKKLFLRKDQFAFSFRAMFNYIFIYFVKKVSKTVAKMASREVADFVGNSFVFFKKSL